MQFEWDEAKREANLLNHRLDFLDARTIWSLPVLDPCAQRRVGAEHRMTALGVVGEDEMVIAVVYPVRDDVVRLISARRARRNERQLYQDRIGRGR